MTHETLGKFSALPANTRVYCTHAYTLTNLQFSIAADAKNEALIERIELGKAKRAAKQPTLPSNIELELATNPFLRWGEPKLQEIIQAQLGRIPSNEVEVFTALRAGKDSF